MGTRGAVGFRIGGRDKVTDNHSSSYPSWLGVRVLEFLRDAAPIQLADAADKIQLVTEHERPTAAQLSECRNLTDSCMCSEMPNTWYELLGGVQGDFSAYTNGGLRYMTDGHEFLADSFFCEYAYIINLDSQRLEVYSGFNHDPKAPGRYAALLDDKPLQRQMGRGVRGSPFFFGVRLIVEEELDKLRKLLQDPLAAAAIADGWEKAIADIREAQKRRLNGDDPQ